MDLFRSFGHLPDFGEPLLELLLLVGVIEALRSGEARLLPVLGIAAMEAHDRERVVRHRRDRWHARGKALRLVDGNINKPMLLEERQGLGPVAVARTRRGSEPPS